MKTTVEISDALLEETKKLASREGTTVRALIEEALRRTIAERARAPRFHLRRASFKGKGLNPDVREGSWERIRELIYEKRGS